MIYKRILFLQVCQQCRPILASHQPMPCRHYPEEALVGGTVPFSPVLLVPHRHLPEPTCMRTTSMAILSAVTMKEDTGSRVLMSLMAGRASVGINASSVATTTATGPTLMYTSMSTPTPSASSVISVLSLFLVDLRYLII